MTVKNNEYAIGDIVQYAGNVYVIFDIDVESGTYYARRNQGGVIALSRKQLEIFR